MAYLELDRWASMAALLCLFALMTLSPPVSQAEAPPEDETEEETEDAPPVWDHQVEVSGGSRGEVTFTPVGVANDVVRPAEEAGSPQALTDVIAHVPGVSQTGQGGLFQVFSIRGVSRQRISTYIGGIRITSERRAGASASFLDPTLMGEISVLRGPATTFYGSGAMGGVVEVGTREFSGWALGTGYESNGNQNYLSVGGGGEGWSIGGARRSASDSEAADGTVLNSGFTQYSAVAKGNWKKGAIGYELLFVPSYAQEIGKSNTDFPARTTDYPRERHGLLQFRATSEKRWSLQAAVHAQDLETLVTEQDTQRRSEVFNSSVDFSLGWHGNRGAGEHLTVSYGADVFGRRSVDALEESQDLSMPQAPVVTSRTLDDAASTEMGLSGSARWDHAATDWEIGARYSWIEQTNSGQPGIDRSAWNGHAGVVHRLGEGFELRGNLGSGIRFPTLTELFFTGTTGRGQVIGNPDLAPERSISLEGSVQWTRRRILLSGGVFGNRIDDYIERVDLTPDLRTFRNIRSGAIVGVELQGLARLGPSLGLSWGGHLMDGKDEQGAPLADVPPAELWLGADYRLDRWTFGGSLTFRASRGDPGPGEKAIPSAALLAAVVRYGWNDVWSLELSARNLLDELYFLAADDKAPFAPGRSFTVQLIRIGR